MTGFFSDAKSIAWIAGVTPPQVFFVAAYTEPSAQISPVAVVFAGRNFAGATARSPVSGMMLRKSPSAATLKTKFGPRPPGVAAAAPAAAAGAAPRPAAAGLPALPPPTAEAGASLPPPRLSRAAIRAAISASCGAPLPGAPTSPFAGRGGRAKPKNASCVGGLSGVARVRGSVIPPGQVGDPAYSRAPAA